MTVLEKLKDLGFDTVPEDFYRHIDDWKSWYDGKVEAFHRYSVFNGQDRINCTRYALGMAKQVCEDWANLLMNERVSITLEGKKEQEFFDTVCKSNNFTVRCNEMQELKAALGTVAYVPRVTGVKVGADGVVSGDAQGIKIDFAYGKNVLPLSWENREVTECAFATEYTSDNDKYVFMQIHKRNGRGEYDIENHLYKNTDGVMAEEKLSSVDVFANVSPVIHTGSTQRQFVIDRLNLVNNVDPTLPMGVSAYANAIDQLKACDIAYDSYVNEFVLGKKRIMVKLSAMKDFDGNLFFDPNDTTYYWLPEDTQEGNTVQEINMELRTAQHNAGIQDMLNALSKRCGFGEEHYKWNQGSIATATQVISQNSEMFRSIKKHEIVLESVLIEFARILLRLGNQYMNMGLNEDVEISVDFDDSIIEDKATDFARDMQLLAAGVLNPYEVRMRWMNEDEETAKSALPKMEDMTDEGQNEIE